MASILSVGELRGLAENSNVVTVPSGHVFKAPGNVLQVVSNNFNDQLSYGSADGTGRATIDNSGFSVIPSLTHTNITAKASNSKYYINFNGNVVPSNTTNMGDGINGFGIVVDENGGTSWTSIGSGLNSSNTSNIKFFLTRISPTDSGVSTYYSVPINGSVLHQSSVNAGTTLRFAIEYYHYDAGSHEIMYINRTHTNALGGAAYAGGLATTITVMEIAG